MKKMKDCPYCKEPIENTSVLIEVCHLTYSILSVYKNQFQRGRCVLSLKEHYEELFEIDQVTYVGFMKESQDICRLISKVFNPGKVQVAFYGDSVRHIHAHIVPKYADLPDWGMPFFMTPPMAYDNTWKEVIEVLRKEMEKCH